MNSQGAPHSLRAWWLAARPKTLSGALVSVVTATALAYASDTPHAAAPLLAVLCAAFAGLMQIASNFINDLIDFRRGRDGEDRLGPELRRVQASDQKADRESPCRDQPR